MSESQNIKPRADASLGVAPTPQNTPLNTQVLAGRPANVGRPQVEDVPEDEDEDDAGDDDVTGANPASLLAKNPALLAMAQARLGSLVGRSSGYVESLPAPVKRRIDGLKGLQAEHAKIETEFQLAILEVEKQFFSKYAPLYERRQAIIAGKAEPTEDEVTAGQQADSDDEDEDEDDEDEGARVTEIKEGEAGETETDVAGVPDFWLTALQNHPPIAESITDADEDALKHLVDVRLSYLESGKPGFKLHFVFSPNDYFTNDELTKTYYYQEQVGYGGDFVYDKAEGSDIKWKEDKDLTKKVEMKKQRNKSTGRTRVVRKVVATDSFFNFFSPPVAPTPEELESGELDEDELEALDERLERDYQQGEDFKEKIIPRAVDYFTGKALRYEDYGDDEFDDDDGFEDDEEDESGDENSHAEAAAATGQDCKQQ
ncbi:histone chaperone [Cryptotrichosporon argae]